MNPSARALAPLLALLVAGPAAPGTAPAAGSLSEIAACLERNVPRRTSEQYLELRAVDATGGERTTRARVMVKRFDDGLRRLVLRFTRPPNLYGVAMLVIESRKGSNETFVYSPELRSEIRLSTAGGGGTLFGTDFSTDDFERWQQLGQGGELTRLPDAKLAGRAVYVLESVPPQTPVTPYERVVSYIDRETCVVLRSEAYETGATLRKVLSASPESVVQDGGVHVATDVRLEDVRDRTYTQVLVEDVAIDRGIDDREFMLSRLRRPYRPKGGGG